MVSKTAHSNPLHLANLPRMENNLFWFIIKYIWKVLVLHWYKRQSILCHFLTLPLPTILILDITWNSLYWIKTPTNLSSDYFYHNVAIYFHKAMHSFQTLNLFLSTFAFTLELNSSTSLLLCSSNVFVISVLTANKQPARFVAITWNGRCWFNKERDKVLE